MSNLRKNTARLLTFAALSAALFANAAWAAAPSADAHQDWAKHRQEWIKHRLDHLADRLEIKASQQAAWQAYTKTIESIVGQPLKKPEGMLDAAGMTRMRADRAAAGAQKLAQVADATAKLQEVLTPEQRVTLNQAVARAGQRFHGRFHGGEHGQGQQGEHGEHGNHWGQPGQEHGFDGNHG
jgi:LTXXQ motif family protein